MGAHKKNPPEGAAEDIQRLASQGFGQLGIASYFSVSRETFKRWVEEDEALNEAYELGKETERQALHALVVQSAVMNKSANVNAFFLLKARHGYVETDNRTKVSVEVAVSNVLIVRDHGSDAEWAAKCAAQQRGLVLDASDDASPLQIEASIPAQVDAVAPTEAPAIQAPVHASVSAPVSIPVPVAPSWVPPVPEAAPVTTVAPPYAHPRYDWRAHQPSAPSWRPRA
jgi:hypothetical protein